MKVRFIKGERITLTLMAKKQRKKTVEIHPNALATNLSNLLPNPIMSMHIPLNFSITPLFLNTIYGKYKMNICLKNFY